MLTVHLFIGTSHIIGHTTYIYLASYLAQQTLRSYMLYAPLNLYLSLSSKFNQSTSPPLSELSLSCVTAFIFRSIRLGNLIPNNAWHQMFVVIELYVSIME